TPCAARACATRSPPVFSFMVSRAQAVEACASGRGSTLRIHVRIAEVDRRNEGFLDRALRHPTHQVTRRARLVVGSGSARAAEGLLANDGAGRFVVDV